MAVSQAKPAERILCVSPGTHLSDVLTWFPKDQVVLAFFRNRFDADYGNQLVLDDYIQDCCI